MIPHSMKYNAEGSAPNFSEPEGMMVERGSQVRLRIKGIRGELGQMFAIGSIREDYLGYALSLFSLAPIWQLIRYTGRSYNSWISAIAR